MNIRRLRLISAFPVVLTTFFCACTYYHVYPGALEPSRAQVTPDQRVEVWQEAVGVLLDQGYVPQVLNERACFISARHREDFENDPLAQTFALVHISPDGVVRVELTGVGYFSSQDAFITAIRERQHVIFDLIMKHAAGLSSSR